MGWVQTKTNLGRLRVKVNINPIPLGLFEAGAAWGEGGGAESARGL